MAIAVVDEVCSRLAEGLSLVEICQSNHMPDYSTVRRWLEKGDTDNAPQEFSEFRHRYARARVDQADALADEMLQVAREATERNVQAKRLLVDTLKWRAGKLKPKVYGEKIGHEHAGPDGGPIPVKKTVDVDLSTVSPEEAARLYREFIKSVG